MADRRYLHATRSGYVTWSVHPLAVTEVDCIPPNLLWAVPFYAGRGGTVSGLWLNEQGTAGSSEAALFRAGIYAAQTAPNPYPGTLLIDAGTRARSVRPGSTSRSRPRSRRGGSIG